MRHLTRRGPVFIAGKLGLHASTVGRVLHRHRTPLLRELDPVTGTIIRAARRSAQRYEHDHLGSLIHVDVKKLGRIPDGGGWRAHGRSEQVRGRGIGYDSASEAKPPSTESTTVEVSTPALSSPEHHPPSPGGPRHSPFTPLCKSGACPRNEMRAPGPRGTGRDS